MEFLPQTLRTRRTRSKETAIDAFICRKAEIDRALERLAALSADHFNISPEDVNWGHVGTLADYAEGLKRITDQALSEGEFARSSLPQDSPALQRQADAQE
jgi:hypothetical protein